MEMNASMEQVVDRLDAVDTYRQFFEIAFPETGLSADNVLRALATYEWTLQSGWSAFDDWVEGDDDAISEAAKRGFALFAGRAGCAECHSGWAFTDHRFHDIGLITDDAGRTAAGQTENRSFKTPGLRNISLRAPYIHNGELAMLSDVLDHYAGLRPSRLAQTQIDAVALSDEDHSDLIAFLESITAINQNVLKPALPARPAR